MKEIEILTNSTGTKTVVFPNGETIECLEIKKGEYMVERFGEQYSIKTDIDYVIDKFGANRYWSCANSIISFVFKGRFFVASRNQSKESILQENGFIYDEFYVPFNYGLPADKTDYENWQKLRLSA